MLHLILIQSHHETCYKLHPNQCTDDSFSSSDDDNTPGVTPSTLRATSENTQVNLENEEEEEKKRISKLYH